MAAIRPTASGLSTPSSPASRTTTRGYTAPAVPKLRDSCHACASSKLKCSKEKPTCSRCTKRGITCEYVATKRGGRRQDRRPSVSNGRNSPPRTTATNEGTHLLLPQSSWFSSNFTNPSTDPQPSPGVIQPTPIPTTSSASSSLFPNFVPAMDQSLTTTLDDFLTSPASFSLPDMSDTDFLDQAQFFSTDIDGSSINPTNLFDAFPVVEDAVSELRTLPNPRSPPKSRTSSPSEAHSQQEPYTTGENCFCLSQALGILRQFSQQPSMPCRKSPTPALDRPVTLTPIHDVIGKNEHTIETIGSMLQCSCSQDGYLLTIMSLIIFKVLGCYVAAARRTPAPCDDSHLVQGPPTPVSRHSPHTEFSRQDSSATSNYGLNEEDSARMAAQLVLSELHRVQRLVNQLSTKLKAQAAERSEVADPPYSLDCESADNETMLPLSALMLSQLETDLRKRLRGVSLSIVEVLRAK